MVNEVGTRPKRRPRFKVDVYRDGRHYKVFLRDTQPPDLQPSAEIASFMMVEGQVHAFLNTLGHDVDVTAYLGIPTNDGDMDVNGDLV